MWVDLFRCYLCQKEGRSPPLRKCTQCEVAYYCSKTCQRSHWKIHKSVCIATVAAKAEDARRERLARAVREKGKDEVEGAEDDALCVICLGSPADPVEVRALMCTRLWGPTSQDVTPLHKQCCNLCLPFSSRAATNTAVRAWLSCARAAEPPFEPSRTAPLITCAAPPTATAHRTTWQTGKAPKDTGASRSCVADERARTTNSREKRKLTNT